MNEVSETVEVNPKRHLFELVFGVGFGLLYALYMNASLSLWFILPFGIINYLFLFVWSLSRHPLFIFVAMSAIGIALGWFIRKLWQQSAKWRIALLALLVLNGIVPYVLLINSFKD